MRISMIGIDHSLAPVDIRAVFSFTKKNAAEFMHRLKEENGVSGCVVLSTCNRTEVYLSRRDEGADSLYALLCREKKVAEEAFRGCFTGRDDREAVEHLFALASGLKSQIMAEDQILTQVKEALSLAREEYCTDPILEVLFRQAVTAAKLVKTEVTFSRGNPSVIDCAIQLLKDQGMTLAGKTCMVIGNGEMGRVAALAMKEQQADVTVTVRQYKSGMVKIPEGCRRIHYGERKELLGSCDLVVSATTSPNYTITKELVDETEFKGPVIMIDLAVPRDIEPAAGEAENITLYDMDTFQGAASTPQMEAELRQARAILEEQIDAFYCWLSGRDVVPQIRKLQECVVGDINLRIGKTYSRAPIGEEERRMLLTSVDTAAGKVVNKLLFGLRETLDQEVFLECLGALEKLYEQ